MTIETLLIVDSASLVLNNGTLNNDLVSHLMRVPFNNSHEIVILTRTMSHNINNRLIGVSCTKPIDLKLFKSMLSLSDMPVLLDKIHKIDIDDIPTLTATMPTLFEKPVLLMLGLAHYKNPKNILFLSHSRKLCDSFSASSQMQSMLLPTPKKFSLTIDASELEDIDKKAFHKIIIHVGLDDTLLNYKKSLVMQKVTLNIEVIKKLKELKSMFPNALLRLSTSRSKSEDNELPSYLSAKATTQKAELKHNLLIKIDEDSYRNVSSFNKPTGEINWKWHGFENHKHVLNILIDDNKLEITNARQQQRHSACKILTIPVLHHAIQPMPNRVLFDELITDQLRL